MKPPKCPQTSVASIVGPIDSPQRSPSLTYWSIRSSNCSHSVIHASVMLWNERVLFTVSTTPLQSLLAASLRLNSCTTANAHRDCTCPVIDTTSTRLCSTLTWCALSCMFVESHLSLRKAQKRFMSWCKRRVMSFTPPCYCLYPFLLVCMIRQRKQNQDQWRDSAAIVIAIVGQRSWELSCSGRWPALAPQSALSFWSPIPVIPLLLGYWMGF